MSNQLKLIIVFSLILVVVLAGFTIYFYQSSQSQSNESAILDARPESTPSSSPLTSAEAKISTSSALVTNSSPDQDLTEKINQLNSRITELETQVNQLLAQDQPSKTTATSLPFQKQIIYIGSAETRRNEWTDTGFEVSLNSSDYPSGVKGIFEAGLSIVGGGEAQARLMNKTTGAVMSITEISTSNSATIWKSSPSFQLFSGSNVYTLQMRSTSNELAKASGARIVISQ